MNELKRDANSSLSLKVTIIVFWGLVVIGISFAILLLGDIEESITERRTMIANDIIYQMHTRFDHSIKSIDKKLISEFLEHKIKAHKDLRVVVFEKGELLITQGDFLEGVDTHTLEYDIKLDYIQGIEQSLNVQVSFSNIKEVTHDKQTQLVMGLGFILLLFGIVLKWVLDHVLTKPLQAMVATAKRLSEGDTDLLFDVSTQDEFAYVAGFINDALRNTQASEQRLKHAKELAIITLHSIAEGVVTVDKDALVIDINETALELMGVSRKDVYGKRIDDVLPVINRVNKKKGNHPVIECLAIQKSTELEADCMVVDAEGREVLVALSAAAIPDPQGFVYGAVMVLHDISESLALQDELTFYASHDALTGLYNRREFDNDLRHALELAKRDNVQHALCYLDLDQFKIVNDTCGHSAGDQLLKNLTVHLLSKLRKADVLARLGGDEFGLLLMYCSMDEAEEVANSLRKAVNEFQFIWEDKKFQIGVSIGLAPVSTIFESAADVLSAADLACYKAKEDGRNRVYVYRPDDDALHQRKKEMSMVSFLHRAFDEDSFELFLQAIQRTDNQLIEHYEVLIRLKDEDGGYMLPGLFLPAAERYQLMQTIDRWVVSNAIKLLSKQLKNGIDISLAINLSGQSIDNKEFLDFVLQELTVLGDQAHRICFEITETTAINHIDSALFFISRIKEKGCSFSLDDFGSGMSSFTYLKNFPVDYLKIDGAFVRGMDKSKIDQAMVRAINEVAKVMGMKTIAEFVENEDIYHCLQNIGVDFAQGYWIDIPRPAKEIFN